MFDVVSVLTQEPSATIIAKGGTEPWTLNRKRVLQCKYLVCCRKAAGPTFSGSDEEVGSAFLVGKIKDVVASDLVIGRWKIVISEFAKVEWLDQWRGKNPVAYWKTHEYVNKGKPYNFENLLFEPVLSQPEPVDSVAIKPKDHGRGLSIAEAKAGLAATFGVDEAAIEITIRL